MCRVRIELASSWLSDGGKYDRQVSGGYRWYLGDITQEQLDDLVRRLEVFGRIEFGKERALTVLYFTATVASVRNVDRIERMLDRMFSDR